jgi:steroid delta-isomerase-like uncharacterized protein
MRRLLCLSALIMVITSACGGRTQPADTQAVVSEYMATSESGDVEKLMALYADDVVWEDPAFGDHFTSSAQVRSMLEGMSLLPDLKNEMTSSFVSADGQWAAVEWTWSGSKGDATYSIRGASILEIRGGKITRETIYYDPTEAPF